DEGDPDRRAGEVAGPRPDLRELLEVIPVAADNEVPALEVLRAAGAPAGPEDAVEVLRCNGSGGELPDGPLIRDRAPDRVFRLAGHEAGCVGASDSLGTGTGGFGTASSARYLRPPETAVVPENDSSGSVMRSALTAAAR